MCAEVDSSFNSLKYIVQILWFKKWGRKNVADFLVIVWESCLLESFRTKTGVFPVFKNCFHNERIVAPTSILCQIIAIVLKKNWYDSQKWSEVALMVKNWKNVLAKAVILPVLPTTFQEMIMRWCSVNPS